MRSNQINILLVEDNPGDARLVKEMLTEAHPLTHELTHLTTLAQARDHLSHQVTDVVLLDLSLPDGQGLECASQLMESFPAVPFVILTGLDDEAVGLESVRRGAQDYLIKWQIDGKLIMRVISYAIERKQAALEKEKLIRELVQVTGGTFQMGSTTGSLNETPVHSVTLGAFYIDKTEITYENWTDVRNWGLTHGYADLPEGRNGCSGTTHHPVTEVDWYDILKWCNASSEKDGLTPVYYTSNTLTTVYRTGQLNLAAAAVKWTADGYRLPTEAEWEFAARGGTKSQGYTYSGSKIVDDVAWCGDNSGNNTHPVSTKGANELGIYDMSGNVWEWCWDWYGSYSSTAQTDPKGPTSGRRRVLRGGSFDVSDSSCHVSVRSIGSPHLRNHFVGFRCVRD